MSFLDEKIAKLQKIKKVAKKREILKAQQKNIEEEILPEIPQEEVTLAIENGKLDYNGVEFEFENKDCFDGMITFPIIKNFFEDYLEDESKYLWNKEKNLNILLSKINIDDKDRQMVDFNIVLEQLLKKNKLYVECSSITEDLYMNYPRNIIKLRMPTAYDYMYQYIEMIDLGKQCIILVFSCLEKDKNKWEKIMIGISELIKINEGDK
ncbi:hypothetical protein [uncultured Clostridium sp.]|uniref:hypothetical protein n=1 Tax=uncultured Clostridium sp. TaxID=59620 RepID=UPI0028E31E00|nr:hypothetical protein [uncultured Clostridium sp.]